VNYGQFCVEIRKYSLPWNILTLTSVHTLTEFTPIMPDAMHRPLVLIYETQKRRWICKPWNRQRYNIKLDVNAKQDVGHKNTPATAATQRRKRECKFIIKKSRRHRRPSLMHGLRPNIRVVTFLVYVINLSLNRPNPTARPCRTFRPQPQQHCEHDCRL